MPSHQRLHRRQWSVGEKWDEIKNDIKHIANDLTNKSPDQTQHDIEIRAPAPSTVFKTVYKTMEPTFTGEIGGYVTMNSEVDGSQTVAAAPEPTTDLSLPQASAVSTKIAGAPVLPDSLVPSSNGAFTERTSLAMETATTTARDQASSTLVPSANNIVTPAASSSTAAAESSSSDGGAAAKAGIAIGVLAGLLIVGLAVFFLFGRRRKQMEKERAAAEAEKSAPFGGAAAVPVAYHSRQPSVQSTVTTRTTATAPQLSLRPVTQFLPEFGERRSSKGAAMALALGPAPSNSQANRPVGQSPWERPMTSQSQSQENPFADHAEDQRSATMEQPNNPFDAPEHVVGVAQTTDAPRHAPNGLSSAAAAAAAAGGGAAAGAALTRKQSVRKDVPQPLDLTRVNEAPRPPPSLASQPSPTGTEFSFTSVAPGQSPGPSKSANAIAAAGGPAHSTVHRVQLDFKPSLEDEMELKAGQLVRLLHEYDDGWALCIRLDRSQQGVVPRTCLSTRPVKPRPAGGPPGARNGPPINPNRGPGASPRGHGPMSPHGGRPQSPAMMGRPQSPAMMRPQSPAMRGPQSPAGMRSPQSPGRPMNGRPASPGPRPMSPAGARGQSPGPRQQGSGDSVKNGRRMTPPGPSPLQQQQEQPSSKSIGRKPVPGQAY